jgi:putative aldouronate transport system permease protein
MKGMVHLYPMGINLESYKTILYNDDIARAYWNTIKYTAVGTSINVLLTSLLAYPLSRKQLYGRDLITTFVIMTMFFGGRLIPRYLIVKGLGMIDTIWAIVLPSAISTYNTIIMRTFFSTIPDSLPESAYIDGASEWTILFRIIIPLSMPIIAVMIMYYGVGHWNSYFSALIYLNSKDKLPMQILLRSLVIDDSSGMHQRALGVEGSQSFVAISTTIKYASIIVTIAPILMVYPILQKWFVKGVMIGSLKG